MALPEMPKAEGHHRSISRRTLNLLSRKTQVSLLETLEDDDAPRGQEGPSSYTKARKVRPARARRNPGCRASLSLRSWSLLHVQAVPESALPTVGFW